MMLSAGDRWLIAVLSTHAHDAHVRAPEGAHVTLDWKKGPIIRSATTGDDSEGTRQRRHHIIMRNDDSMGAHGPGHHVIDGNHAHCIGKGRRLACEETDSQA